MLPDVLAHNLRLVICGTAAGEKSALRTAYYADGRNRFWQVLEDVGLTPHRLLPDEFPNLIEYGIGLTDLAKGVSGCDDQIDDADFDTDAFESRISTYKPRLVCFNGKKAAEVYLGEKRLRYGPQPSGAISGVQFFVATSTSGQNGHWDIAPWEELAALVKS